MVMLYDSEKLLLSLIIALLVIKYLKVVDLSCAISLFYRHKYLNFWDKFFTIPTLTYPELKLEQISSSVMVAQEYGWNHTD